MDDRAADHDTMIESYLMLPADQIPYDSLTSSVLLRLVTQRVEPFVATSALGELAQRFPEETRDAATRILDGERWDSHLTAYALTLLYDRDPGAAIARMAKLAGSCEDATVLEAMVENIVGDAERFLSSPGEPIASTLARRVADRPGMLKDVELRERFLGQFGGSPRRS